MFNTEYYNSCSNYFRLKIALKLENGKYKLVQPKESASQIWYTPEGKPIRIVDKMTVENRYGTWTTVKDGKVLDRKRMMA